MPTLSSGGTFENNWKNILDKLRSVLRTEYGNTLPVYIGDEDSASSSQYTVSYTHLTLPTKRIV